MHDDYIERTIQGLPITHNGQVNKRPEKLLIQARSELCRSVRENLHTQHCSIHTEESCVRWIECHILFHDERHPYKMDVPQIEESLTHRGRIAR
jgi:hypothetical protein